MRATATLRIARTAPGRRTAVETFTVPYETAASVLDLAARESRSLARLPLQLHQRERVQGMHHAD